MSDPLISVVMPVYNAADYLGQAVSSILAQTLRDYEFIIVNDGSTDRSGKMLEQFAKKDKRIKLISKPNTGIVAALNDGLAQARGTFIARMDADDISLPNRFALQLDYVQQHSDCVALGSRVVAIDPYGCELYRSEHKLDHDEIDRELLNGSGWAIVHPVAMMRREAIERVAGYRKQWQWVEDLDLFLRLAEIGKLANLSDMLLHYRQHTESINRTRSQQQAELADACVREAYQRRGLDVPAGWKYQPKPRPAKDVQLRTWAWKALGRGNVQAARKHAVNLWKTSPFSVESWRTLLCAMRGY